MNIFSKIRKVMGGGASVENEDICPVCGKADQVIPIRYGKPNNTLMERANRGEVRLGGCMAADRPSRYCKRDDHEF